MEVVKAALSHVYATQERAVIRAEQKSYGYAQIVASAVNISNLLHDADVKTVRMIFMNCAYAFLSNVLIVHFNYK